MYDISNVSDAMRRVLKARARIAQTQVFFASTIYGARLVETPEAKRMRTNGTDIQFDADFVKKADPYIEGVLLHEVLHCALNHPARRQSRDPQRWNKACDLSINPLIAQYFSLPPDAVMDSRYQGKSPERIYKLLKMMEDGEGDGQGKGKAGKGGQPLQGGKGKQSPDGSEPMYDGGDTEQDIAAAQHWNRVTNLAAEKATKAGEMSGTLKELVEQLFSNDTLDWKSIIRDMARDAKEDTARSWAQPNRRFIAMGLHMPGKGIDKITRLVLCIDSSGSISHDALKEMKAQAMSLLEQSLVNEVMMISTDTKVCSSQLVTTSEEAGKFDLGPHGGGTNFKDAMDLVGKQHGAMGCVFFTDMETNSFGAEPPFPVVWVNWGNAGHKAPFGRTAMFK